MTFNLSERLEDAHPYVLEQVKEFVRLLKELASDCLWTNNSKAVSKTVFFNELDKLAGDKLIVNAKTSQSEPKGCGKKIFEADWGTIKCGNLYNQKIRLCEKCQQLSIIDKLAGDKLI